MVYSKIYFNYCDPILEKYAKSNYYDIYLLMDIDIPWIKDDLRDKPNERKEMFDFFKSSLIESQKSFDIISGNFEERKEKAISIINNLLNFTS
jgi:nicotinamide riboside kinase